MAAAVPREVRIGGESHARVRQFIDSGQRNAELPSAPLELDYPQIRVLATVAARQPTGAPDRQVDLSPSQVEFFGDLHPRLARSDDENGAGRQRVRPGVVARMELRHAGRHGRGQLRDSGNLEPTRGHDNLPGGHRTAAGLEQKATVGNARQSVHGRAEDNRRVDDRRVVGDPRRNLVPRHEAVRIVAVIRVTGQ